MGNPEMSLTCSSNASVRVRPDCISPATFVTYLSQEGQKRSPAVTEVETVL
jgi:hypothetical protein